jgi:selenocysteine lyase/cysteine desulfurase
MSLVKVAPERPQHENLEDYFGQFRQHIIGHHYPVQTPYGEKKLIYADWVASGRLYRPIEERLLGEFGPLVGNTHSESSITGTAMTHAYHLAHQIIKRHVNAGPQDALLFVGFGMTASVNKLQRLLGLKIPERFKNHFSLPEELRPVVFVTHMEHHSNQTTWYETLADVHVIKPDAEGLIDFDDLHALLDQHKKRKLKIGSFTASSNVTGIQTPYHKLARIMHEHGGICLADFAASAPYVDIDMHPSDPLERLDAITFSPHKFLGGPGASGVLVFDSTLYTLKSPEQPGGGTVLWTNPWGQYRYFPDIEVREDGGTPGFLQAIRAALAIELKEKMDPQRMLEQEHRLVSKTLTGLREIPGLTILADNIEHRLGIISFYLEEIHYNLVVKLLNDRFGIQTRGGCSCAGTYGHYLLHVDKYASKRITNKIDEGDLSIKPGWVRLSLHPTTTDEEIDYILGAVHEIRPNAKQWESDYTYDPHTNEYTHKLDRGKLQQKVEGWFKLEF